jgi:CBS domain-containing protein
MSKQVRSVSANVFADVAWQIMTAAGIHHLVVMEGDQVTGVISQRDLGGVHGASVRAGKRVADLMTSSVVFASPETTLTRAASLMRGHVIGCLPVIESKQLVGIVTITDLLDALSRIHKAHHEPAS